MLSIHDEFLELIHEFESLPDKQESESIFDIAGYPHYENVASNILAFYLNPNNEHGLGDLLLSSLMNIAGKSSIHLGNIQVSHEVSTNKGGRLDIVIETDSQIVGIENKIFHHLINDLEDYSTTIDEWASLNQLDTSKIILSIKNEGDRSQFINVTYEEYWESIKERMGNYVNPASQKWLLYLIDFMSTIEKLSGENMQLDENDLFFIEHDERVSALVNARNKFISKLHNAVRELKDLSPPPAQCVKQWVYAKCCLVHDFEFAGNSIAFDIYVSSKGWELQIFGRNAKSQAYLKELFARAPLSQHNVKLVDSKYILGSHKLSTDLVSIKDNMFEWFDRLIESNDIKNANV